MVRTPTCFKCLTWLCGFQAEVAEVAGGDPLGPGPLGLAGLAELASRVWCSMNQDTPGSWGAGQGQVQLSARAFQWENEWLSCAESTKVWMELWMEFMYTQKISSVWSCLAPLESCGAGRDCVVYLLWIHCRRFKRLPRWLSMGNTGITLYIKIRCSPSAWGRWEMEGNKSILEACQKYPMEQLAVAQAEDL